ncbi:AMP-binding protein [Nonomuraea sp. NPDC050556]|uniref:AMP-binding protein n=1 Tax=Nonomuraea sp. NPDC050556 TaxID=3364369 RepID=UPI0037A2567A
MTVFPPGSVAGAVLSAARGDRPALLDLAAGSAHTHRELAEVVAGAAGGLVRRGARPGQVVGVLTGTTTAQTLAVHAVMAADGTAAPLSPDRDPAAVLREWDARMLIVTPDLAEPALELADDTPVRQLICIGGAPDCVDFADLLTGEQDPLPDIDPVSRLALVMGREALTHAELLAFMPGLARLEAADVLLVSGGGRVPVPLVALALQRGALVVAAHHATSELVLQHGVTAIGQDGGTVRQVTYGRRGAK